MSSQMPQQRLLRTKWSTRRKIIIGLAAIAATAWLVIMPAIVWQLHEANGALRTFADDLVAKRYRDAYQSTATEFRASVDYAKFVSVHNGLSARMGDLRSIRVTNSEVKELSDGWHGTADVDLQFARGVLPFTFILRKENGAWRIYSYRED